MAIILNIETSTTTCSAALAVNGKLVKNMVTHEGMNHAKKLPLFIEELLQFAKDNTLKIEAVAVSSGPGSYTGLRIGVSTAKGLCYGLQVPLISIDTLATIAYPVLKESPKNALICPMIDARRMEVYTALYDNEGKRINSIEAKIIDETAFQQELNQQAIYFCGNGSQKCESTLIHDNAHFVHDITPLAENMVSLSETKFENKEFENVAYFEPFYLKEFQAMTSKKKLF